MASRKPPRRVYFAIPAAEVRQMGVAGALDMLRFDSAEVESNAPVGHYLFSSDREPTRARWVSFGVRTIYGSYAYVADCIRDIEAAKKNAPDAAPPSEPSIVEQRRAFVRELIDNLVSWNESGAAAAQCAELEAQFSRLFEEHLR